MFDKHHKKENPTFTGITRGVGGFGFGAAAGAGVPDDYWLVKFGDEVSISVPLGDGRDALNETFNGLAIDDDENLYAVGTNKFRGGSPYNYGIILVKYDKSGTLLWQRSIDSASLGHFHDIGFGIALDSSNNIYICGATEATGFAGTNDAYVARYDSDGNFHWDATIGVSSYASGYYFRDITVDSSGNIYLVGSGSSLLVKIGAGTGNNAPTLSQFGWARYAYAVSSEECYSVKMDSSGNLYYWSIGYDTQHGGGCMLYKYNSSGTLLQHTRYTIPYSSQFGNHYWEFGVTTSFSHNDRWAGGGHMVIDSQGDIYVTHVYQRRSPQTRGYQTFLLKLNSSGTIQWKKDFYSNSSSTSLHVWHPFITVDDSDNLYMVLKLSNQDGDDSFGYGDNKCHIIKMNSSGTIQWHNILHGDQNGGDKEPKGIMSKGDNLYIFGWTEKDTHSRSEEAFIFKIPNDGSLTNASIGKKGSTWGSNVSDPLSHANGYEFMYEPYYASDMSVGDNFNTMYQQDASNYTLNYGNKSGISYNTNLGMPKPTINFDTDLIDFN